MVQTDTDDVVYLGDDKPVPLKNTQNKNSSKKGGQKISFEKEETNESDAQTKQNQQQNQQQGLKRGQRGKLKKIKEKYKDQDEEDRKLLMAVLQVLFINFFLKQLHLKY